MLRLEARLAWRNVWRNPRRTGLCVAATVFAVALVVLSVAMADGTHEKMIEDGVRLQSGHVSIAGEGWLEKGTLEQHLRVDPELAGVLDARPEILGWAPRLASFALLSFGDASHGAVVLGVDPAREGRVTNLPERVVAGAFLSDAGGGGAEREVVLGRRLAKSLGVRVGDEVLAYGVAYSLETAYELFRVVGLLALPEPDLERNLALVRLADAQAFYVFGDRVSEIGILVHSADEAGPLREALDERLPPGLEVHTWDEVLPELAQFIVLDDAGMYLTLVILVVVVAFGILNTVLMAILERTQELGMMRAVGLRPAAIFRMVWLESLLLAGVGLVLGLALAIPGVLWLAAHPIPLSGEMAGVTELFGMEPVLTLRLTAMNPIGSALTILVVGGLASLYPAWKAGRGEPVDALRTV